MRAPAPDAKDVHEILTTLDTRGPISEGRYLAGDEVTIADIITASTLTFLEVVDFNYIPYPNLNAWMAKLKAKPFYIECNAGFEKFKQYTKTDEFAESTAMIRQMKSK